MEGLVVIFLLTRERIGKQKLFQYFVFPSSLLLCLSLPPTLSLSLLSFPPSIPLFFLPPLPQPIAQASQYVVSLPQSPKC